MKKYSNDFELYVYQLMVNSPLAQMISGKVYRNGMRPINSDKEDIVVSFLSGINTQFQECVVNVNIFVPDISFNGGYVKNIGRLAILENEAKDYLEAIIPNEFLIALDMIPTTVQVEGFNQHFINIRLIITYNSIN